jgi:Ran-binding protein 1
MWFKPETVEKDKVAEKNVWKDRGVGFFKIKRDNEKREISCIMRQEKTLKVVANFIVAPWITLTKHNSDKSFRLIFSAHDCS